MKYLLIYFLLLAGVNGISAQHQTRELQAVRTHQPPDIDGIESESSWRKAPAADGFYQYEPHNDRPASFDTRVKVLYDDNALYIFARLYDPEPDLILTEIGPRNSGNNINAEQFWIDINPFDDGVNGFRFMVSSSGVQTDINISGTDGMSGDVNWDAVWESAVNIDDRGWTVEVRIPYSALRFPRNSVQEWGINFWREIRRKREQSSWNFVNRRVGDVLAYMGLLRGIEGITPPLRLSFFPYVSTYLENSDTEGEWTRSSVAGMDLKYGISNSFTLDMTLIPDFGQVQSDARVLNLSPYEVKYDENRQFFTEGTELFGKADVFYSRRIGDTPKAYGKVTQELNPGEVIEENPLETRMINATKVSGRTSSGLGLGIFNAMTAESRAVIRDTLTGGTRELTTQPFTNYSVLVADQSLRNNSFASLINTNVSGAADGYMANVTATEFRFMDASNNFRINGNMAVSQQYESGNDNVSGYTYDITAGKVSGTWQYAYNRLVYSDTYDPNDLGYLAHNNLVMNKVSFSHNIFDPFWRLWNLRNELSINYNQLHTPSTFSGFNIGYSLRALFDTRFFILWRANYRPVGHRDYFEPRVPGKFYETDAAYDLFLMYSTDYRKRVYLDGNFSYDRIMSSENQYEYGFELKPTFRVSDRLNMTYGFNYNGQENDIGYVRHTSRDNVFFGKRNTDTYINTLSGSYMFSNALSLQLDFRHYWSLVEYLGDYYLLKDDGSLLDVTTDLQVNDINFNAFTVDMLLTWHFAPGSQVSLAWKNVIDSHKTHLRRSYFDNLRNTLEEPQVNSLSLKLLYYLDYAMLQGLF